MYAILKNNVCVGVQSLPLDEASLASDESQVELAETEVSVTLTLLGQTYQDGQFVATAKSTAEKQSEANATNRLFLRETDWQVTRHRDQLDLGGATSLTAAEYQALLQERQQARAAVS
jgi:hypothetical protein